MEKFELYLSVNGGEYYSLVRLYGNECIVGEPIEEDFETWYPIYLNGKRIDFDEPLFILMEKEQILMSQQTLMQKVRKNKNENLSYYNDN